MQSIAVNRRAEFVAQQWLPPSLLHPALPAAKPSACLRFLCCLQLERSPLLHVGFQALDAFQVCSARVFVC